MKKNIVIIIVAICLIIAGAALACAALVAVDFDFGKFSNVDYERNSYVLEGDIGKIGVIVQDHSVIILPSEDGICKIEVDESDNSKLEYRFAGNHLVIKMTDDRKWHDRISFFSAEADLVLYLPAGEYDRLSVETDAGDVKVSEEFSFTSVLASAGTGDIDFSAKTHKELSLSCSTGDITVRNVEPEDLCASVSTGNIVVENIKASDKISLFCNTGKIEVHGSETKKIECRGTTGDILLKYVTAEGYVHISRSTGDVTMTSVIADSFVIKTSTGDVKLNLSDADEINIETDTGRVDAILLSEKIFKCESSTGRIKIPDTHSGGICKIKTSTGNINISIN